MQYAKEIKAFSILFGGDTNENILLTNPLGWQNINTNKYKKVKNINTMKTFIKDTKLYFNTGIFVPGCSTDIIVKSISGLDRVAKIVKPAIRKPSVVTVKLKPRVDQLLISLTRFLILFSKKNELDKSRINIDKRTHSVDVLILILLAKR